MTHEEQNKKELADKYPGFEEIIDESYSLGFKHGTRVGPDAEYWKEFMANLIKSLSSTSTKCTTFFERRPEAKMEIFPKRSKEQYDEYIKKFHVFEGISFHPNPQLLKTTDGDEK